MTEQAYSVTAGEIRQRIEVIERLMADGDEIKVLIKEAFDSAKVAGFDAKVLRKLISLRKRDKDDVAEEEAILELYKSALGM